MWPELKCPKTLIFFFLNHLWVFLDSLWRENWKMRQWKTPSKKVYEFLQDGGRKAVLHPKPYNLAFINCLFMCLGREQVK